MNNTTAFRFPSRSCRVARVSSWRRTRGVTLVEMLVVMGIAALLSFIAIPSMSAMVDSVKLSSASNIFVSGLYLARGEAIKRNGRVVLCKSATGVTCASNGGWEQGWIVFHDVNNNGAREDTEQIVRREQALSASLRFTGNLNVASYVSFAPSGATRLVSGGFQAGTLTLCHQSTQAGEARRIVLNAVGRPRVHKTAVDSCV